MSKDKLPFDTWMSPYWGSGHNPPSVNFMAYALFILFLCYSVFSLLSEYDCSVIFKTRKFICADVSFVRNRYTSGHVETIHRGVFKVLS